MFGDFVITAVIAAFVALLIGSLLWENRRKRRLAKMTIVQEGVEYPNNYHVLGVGYYHAASRQWYRHPWNEFREGRGFFWYGQWNPTPDQRSTEPTVPAPEEVLRVNEEWRRADPDKMEAFWSGVDRFGFGGATYRAEGS